MKKSKRSFFKEVKQEYKNVSWPSKEQVVSSTGVVIFFVVLISLFLGFVDYSVIEIGRASCRERV